MAAVDRTFSREPAYLTLTNTLVPAPISTGTYLSALQKSSSDPNIHRKIHDCYNALLAQRDHASGRAEEGQDSETPILFPGLYAKAIKNVLGNCHVYQLVKSHIGIPNTATFYYFLEEKNARYQRNIRGAVNQKYNELLVQNRRHTCLIPGQTAAALGNDRMQPIFYPSLYLQAYVDILQPLEGDSVRKGLCYKVIRSYDAKKFRESFHDHFVAKERVYGENIGEKVNRKYSQLLVENKVHGAQSNQTTEISHPEFYSQAYFEIMESLGANNPLNARIYQSAKKLIEQHTEKPLRLTEPMAETGFVITTFFPRAIPEVVLREKQLYRVPKYEKARRDCVQFPHLVVPRTQTDEETGFLVVERLPVNWRNFPQAIFYNEHREEFTQAIREFTDYFCQHGLYDFQSHHNVTGLPLFKFANYPFFYHPRLQTYCIGMIDLEPGDCEKLIVRIEDRLAWMALYFPYHLEVILQIGQKYVDMALHEAKIRKEAAKGEQIFVFIQSHKDFLTQAGITPAHPTNMIPMNDQRVAEIVEQAYQLLKEIYDDLPIFLDQETYKDFKKVVPETILTLQRHLKERLARTIDTVAGGNITSFSQLQGLRVISLSLSELSDNEDFHFCYLKSFPQIEMLKLYKVIPQKHKSKYDAKYFHAMLLHAILKKMESKEFFKYVLIPNRMLPNYLVC